MKSALFIFSICILFCRAVALSADPARLIHRWEREPDLGTSWQFIPVISTPTVHPERLSSPLMSARLNEAQVAIRNSENPRLQGAEQSLPVLLEQLQSLPENRSLRLTMASAAIALAKPADAEQLWERLRNNADTRPLIERALVDWKLPLAIESWRQRLASNAYAGTDLLVAIEGIGALGDKQDQQPLEALLRDDRCLFATKLAIARALARVAPSGLENLATEVLKTNIKHRELLAVELLSLHTSDSAQAILRQMLNTEHLPAQKIAYDTIAKNFPTLASEQAGEMLSRPDNNLRLKAVEVLNRHDDLDSLRLQALGLDDRNQVVRNTVRENMARKAELPQLRPLVDEVIAYHLNGKSPRATEQAIKLAVTLRETERCPHLFSLLEHPQLEITVYAAWALQELVDAPQIVEDIFKFTQPTTKRLSARESVSELEILRQSFLFEALGRNFYQPAAEELKLYVPKGRSTNGWAVSRFGNLGARKNPTGKQR